MLRIPRPGRSRLTQRILLATLPLFRLDVRPPFSSVRGSKDKLKQVLRTLVLNARDAMPHGDHLTLRVYGANGAGIPGEDFGKMLEHFSQPKNRWGVSGSASPSVSGSSSNIVARYL